MRGRSTLDPPTEVHRDWVSPAGEVEVSPPRGGAPDTQRWVAVHLDPDTPAIDHLAVSEALAHREATVHRPHRDDGSLLSDHAAYTADLRVGVDAALLLSP